MDSARRQVRVRHTKEPECERLKCGHRIFILRGPCQGLLRIRFPLRKSVPIKRHIAKEAEEE